MLKLTPNFSCGLSEPFLQLQLLILWSLSLDPETVRSDFIRVKYHKEYGDGKVQAPEKNF
jgi:hypothetical protein